MNYAAIDLGAESGRVILGTLENDRLGLAEIHRFPTGGRHLPDGSYRWDFDAITAEIFSGLRKIAAQKIPLRSISTDSWGVDYLWLDKELRPLAPPRHYRDPRNDTAAQRFLQKLPFAEIFTETGIQFLPFNTLYQLCADITQGTVPPGAGRFLLVADYVNCLLSGRAAVEESNASTTQLYNPRTRGWSEKLSEKIGLEKRLLPEIVPPATVLAQTLAAGTADATGLPRATPVVAGCSHDTAAAIFAVPADARNGDWAYLSSGTWSLLGVELPDRVIINEDALAANFTNEIGHAHSTRFLKNIIGMWRLQECRRAWAASGVEYSYAQLQQIAGDAAPLRSLINPGDPRFAAPGQMPEKIAAFCRETGQPQPRTHGETIRAALESLALLYAMTLARLDMLAGRETRHLHIVGGGSQNTLLNQLTANATGLPVHAGPVEATAIGNIMLQAVALGDVPSHHAARRIVRESFAVQTFAPDDTVVWRSAREQFRRLLETKS